MGEEQHGLNQDSADKEEGLQMLLGGLSLAAFENVQVWDVDGDPSVIDPPTDDRNPDTVTANISPSTCSEEASEVESKDSESHSLPRILSSQTHPCSNEESPNMQQEQEPYVDEAVFERAFTCRSDGQVALPPVLVVHQGPVRGHALQATRHVPAGQVIFTEPAAVASQVSTTVRACQNCFCSLEPIESCCDSTNDRPQLPSSDLWPVPTVESTSQAATGKSTTAGLRTHGPLQCSLCESWFCSPHCQLQASKQFGPCCRLATAMRKLRGSTNSIDGERDANVEGEETEHINCACQDNGRADRDDDVQPAVLLAVRMFVSHLHGCRTCGNNNPSTNLLAGLCGEASNVRALELGLSIREDDGHVHYTLSPVYRCLVHTLGLTTTEQRGTFTLDYFTQLVAVAARNGVGLLTASPFQSYYAALVRSVGGRGTSRHAEMRQTVAQALGEKTSFSRGMDRAVDDRVTPQVVAVFPLTARINHSCRPNAEIRSQQFTDARIDVCAIQDIEAGQEISISYIGTGPSSAGGRQGRRRRQTELQQKYLFVCDCPRCKEEESL